ncbi:LEA type 2 family protein [Paludibacterium paludis]|uniref:Late embryogenesis abundant protein LEA-2 subgroup domain-containing protein n=1 Tax=Paludibacterium paludis TaxID=1225769 RepID=A0A918NWX1_9NEIS|nr:LEA type 2 family protein [Paludibacterium paludis]GGY03199.1 hypothetical protein GCM10011289_01850 [Paludibacterium paludis]
MKHYWPVAALCLSLAACDTYRWQKPTFTVLDIRPVRASLAEPELDLTLDIGNPNDRVITATGLAFDLKIDGRPVASSVPSPALTLAPGAATRVTLRVKGRLEELLPLLARYREIRRDGVAYELDGRVEDINGKGPMPFKKQGVWKSRPPADR